MSGMAPERARFLTMGGLSLPLPCFFASISSVKANLDVPAYLQVIECVGYSAALVSAYDLHHSLPAQQDMIASTLDRLSEAGTAILLDSGNYESYWHRDGSWSPAAYGSILTDYTYHAAFCFDNRNAPVTADAIAEDVITTVIGNQAGLTRGTILPILHGQAAILPAAAQRVARELCPLMLAIPERALGNGLIERARCLQSIRRALDDTGVSYPLHLLGTGNPLSLFVYACCGADSFDGLEWCQTAVDHAHACLHHFQHWDLFASQTPLGQGLRLPYAQRVLVHNLLFYSALLADLHEARSQGKVMECAGKYFPDYLRKPLEQALGRDVLYG